MELKDTIEAIGKAFEKFKAENDTRIKEIETKGNADPLLAEKVEKINTEVSSIAAMKKQLEAIETAVARSEFSGGGIVSKEVENKAKAFSALMRRGEQNIADIDIKAAASTLSDPDGGFTVPEEVDGMIDRVALSVSAMRRLCTVRSISTDTYKKLVGQGGATSGWVTEKGARAETSTPTLAEIAINTKEIYAMPAATQTLLDDSSVNIGAWLADEVGIVFNEQESDAFITGDGVAKPKGIAAYTMVANANYVWGKVGFITSGHATLLNSTDRLIDLQHSLKPVYRNGSSFLTNDNTVAIIRKLKDSDNNYLWKPGLIEGAPNTLFGKPVEVDDNIADVGANAFAMFYGNFKRAYMIVDRIGTRVLRDPFTSKPYVLFYTTKRVGGGITHYEAIKALKIAA